MYLVRYEAKPVSLESPGQDPAVSLATAGAKRLTLTLNLTPLLTPDPSPTPYLT